MYTEEDNNKKNKKENNNSFYDYENDYSVYEDNALYDETPSDNNFYKEMKINIKNEGNEDKKLKKVFIIIIGTAILGIIGIILAVVLLSKTNNEPEVEIKLLEEKIIISVGEEKSVSYEVINASEDIHATFKSKNSDVVSVDNNGKIKGLKEGDSVITISFKSGRKTKEKKFDVIVVKK